MWRSVLVHNTVLEAFDSRAILINEKPSSANKNKNEPSFKVSHLRKIQIVNCSPSKKSGEHWLLLCAIDNGDHVGIFVWDCLGRPSMLFFYDQFYSRLSKLSGKCGGVQSLMIPLQKLLSNLCGLYCLYLVHYLVGKSFNVYRLQKTPILSQDFEIDIVPFFNEHVKYCQFKHITLLNFDLWWL